MFKDLDRVIIAVKDLNKSKDFFEDLFDIEFDVFEGHEGLKIRGAYSASRLELIEPYGDDSFLHKYLEKKGEGIMGIVVRVKDIEAAAKKMEEKGLQKTMDIQVGKMREIGFNAKGSHGVEIVLAEYPEKHGATMAIWGAEAPES